MTKQDMNMGIMRGTDRRSMKINLAIMKNLIEGTFTFGHVEVVRRGQPRPHSGARARAGEPCTDSGGTAPTQCPAKPRTAFARCIAPGQGPEHRPRVSQPPVRPVLKHQPKSLANARVTGRAQTLRAQ